MQTIATPPSCVLCIKTHDMQENELRENLAPFADYRDVPIFIQAKKLLAFVQFPSLDQATQCLEFLNGGSLVTAQDKTVTAEYSNRQEVTVRGASDNRQQSGSLGSLKPITTGMNKRPRDDFHTTSAPPFVAKRPNLMSRTTNGPINGNEPPSPVLCVKSDLSENELINLLQSLGGHEGFSSPVDIMSIAGKTMSFVQYQDVRQSSAALKHMNENQYQTPSGLVMAATFSKRHSIQRDVNREQQHQPQQQHVGFVTGDAPGPKGPKKPEAPPSKVVIVTLRPVRQQQFQLTLDNILLPFSRFGMVQKIILFSKKDTTDLQALVQYDNLQFAQLARERMDNQIVDSFRVMVRFSERPELNIEHNGERMRDYSNPWLSEAAH
eukprot:GEMP01050954.1.p1 GENE.GEMP01050954.1~~GEMP01050954.1.p1  ORF type:complete len:380 (+),score=87.80 GEMP01050954.1:64-1203(+)